MSIFRRLGFAVGLLLVVPATGWAQDGVMLDAIFGTAGDVGAGRDAFRTSLRLDPRDTITYINLARQEMAAGQRDVATDRFAEALSLDPNSAPAREGLAQARSAR